MSYKHFHKTFLLETVVNGSVVAEVDAGQLNWLSFQVKPVVTGGTPDVDVTIEESNEDVDSSYIATAKTVNYVAAGAKNALLSIEQATSRFYRISVDIVAGGVSAIEVIVCGKG